MGFYEEQILPWCIELCCGMKALHPERAKATAGLHGRVLEIGFGSGMNLPYYPSDVTEVIAVDPSLTAHRIAQRRIENAPVRVTLVGLDAQRIICSDDCADAALSTFTLCTVKDAARVLAEVRRVLKPGGRLHFLEHGRAPDPDIARWQQRLNRFQRAIAGGCELVRDIPQLLQDAGFHLESLTSGYFPGMPKTHGYLYLGTAQNLGS